jgi:GNAT superfamily N-acetyltransferase
MRTRKKAVVGRQKPELGEQTAVPVGGDLAQAQMGAAMYLAVLAYPAHSEWPKRDEFIEAVKALLVKRARRRGYPRKLINHKYRRFKNEHIDGILNRAFRRISRRRLPAGQMAFWIICGAMSKRTNITLNKLSYWWATRVWPGFPDAEAADVKRRVWRETLPVLHLVMVFPRGLILNGDGLGLILNPSCLPGALRTAQYWRHLLKPLQISVKDKIVSLSPSL